MRTRYRVQRFVWTDRGYDLASPSTVEADSPEDAAERFLRRPVARGGRIGSVSVRVWAVGRAKRLTDIHHFW